MINTTFDSQEFSQRVRDSLQIELEFRDYEDRDYIDVYYKHYIPHTGSKLELKGKKYTVKELEFDLSCDIVTVLVSLE